MSSLKDYEPLFGSWYVDKELGEGSCGKVYSVHSEGRCSAVRMISVPQSEADLERARLEMNEHALRSYFSMFVQDIVQAIDIMNALKGCNNIVSLEDHEVIQNDALHWDILIRMELLRPLCDYSSFSAENVVKMGIDISCALEACGEKIHVDVKPGNIFVSERGDFKLDVFGSYCREHSCSISRRGLYMAPEVLRGERDYGPSVNLYALGMVMYRCLNNNRLPFMPPYPEAITPKIMDDAFMRRMKGEEMLPDIPDIDPVVNAFIMKACAFKPEDRYQTAGEFRADFESVRDILNCKS